MIFFDDVFFWMSVLEEGVVLWVYPSNILQMERRSFLSVVLFVFESENRVDSTGRYRSSVFLKSFTTNFIVSEFCCGA